MCVFVCLCIMYDDSSNRCVIVQVLPNRVLGAVRDPVVAVPLNEQIFNPFLNCMMSKCTGLVV